MRGGRGLAAGKRRRKGWTGARSGLRGWRRSSHTQRRRIGASTVAGSSVGVRPRMQTVAPLHDSGVAEIMATLEIATLGRREAGRVGFCQGSVLAARAA
ncbi:vegetative cell wall protein gp1-like [Iris pallida]|uniref:Vegetative cell wall protein gp1-like n=1 Tax=Iris pallida TaxID=29817 RepID=A0AAX6IIC1_IRIPA|nr:vegetative cell wall protein gp1-like [Iris pallida]